MWRGAEQEDRNRRKKYEKRVTLEYANRGTGEKGDRMEGNGKRTCKGAILISYERSVGKRNENL